MQKGEAVPQSFPVEGGADEHVIVAAQPDKKTELSDSNTKVIHPPNELIIVPGPVVPE